jgi:hypothetical protein
MFHEVAHDNNVPIPISFAFSCAASEAILAASRERVGRLFVADMIAVFV